MLELIGEPATNWWMIVTLYLLVGHAIVLALIFREAQLDNAGIRHEPESTMLFGQIFVLFWPVVVLLLFFFYLKGLIWAKRR